MVHKNCKGPTAFRTMEVGTAKEYIYAYCPGGEKKKEKKPVVKKIKKAPKVAPKPVVKRIKKAPKAVSEDKPPSELRIQEKKPVVKRFKKKPKAEEKKPVVKRFKKEPKAEAPKAEAQEKSLIYYHPSSITTTPRAEGTPVYIFDSFEDLKKGIASQKLKIGSPGWKRLSKKNEIELNYWSAKNPLRPVRKRERDPFDKIFGKEKKRVITMKPKPKLGKPAKKKSNLPNIDKVHRAVVKSNPGYESSIWGIGAPAVSPKRK